jgi:hypothetical protein
MRVKKTNNQKLMNIFKELKNFEMHHKILAFLAIMITTILLVRLSVIFYNPNPSFFNFELHHFDYGILLLLITNLLLLFGKKRYVLHHFASAVAFGLILDDIWFIRSNILEPGFEELSLYNATFPSVIILVMTVILISFWINYSKEKKNKKK